MQNFIASDYQTPWNELDFIVQVDPNNKTSDDMTMDVLFVGAGPASLTSAIRLADLAKAQGQSLQIGIMEKADQLGGHSLSGAVINPLVFQWLFPDKNIEDFPFKKKVTKESFFYLNHKQAYRLPIPPGMRAKGHYTASLCEVVRYLGREAEQRGIHIFTSFPVQKLLMCKNQVVGVQSKAYGLNKDGTKEQNSQDPEQVFAKIVVLAEGSRGHLTQTYLKQQNIKSVYPQTYALGVKEIWEVQKQPEGILHTIAWPLDNASFGGSWLYPLEKNLVSLGLVVGLDSPKGDLSVHDKLQELKTHPLFAKYLKGGRVIEWGAKTIPEGGYHALPTRWHGDGIMLIGDSVGLVNMASLKGIHYAMASGYYAAKTILQALKDQDFSETKLQAYKQQVQNSFIYKDLYKYRNLRQSFHKGLWRGLINAAWITITQGRFPRDFKGKDLKSDNKITKNQVQEQVLKSKLDKLSAVYLSGNKTRDKIPSHLILKDSLPKAVTHFYEKLCPAGVYENKSGFIVNSTNCIDCKATDILGPRWTPRERGSGPNYKNM